MSNVINLFVSIRGLGKHPITKCFLLLFKEGDGGWLGEGDARVVLSLVVIICSTALAFQLVTVLLLFQVFSS